MMLKEILKKYKKEIDEILDALSNCSFYELDVDDFENDFIDVFKEKYHKNFTISSGATKGVIIFKNFNFVIKIPFYYCDEEELSGADETDESWNYCAQEVARYEMASDDGFKDIFLEVQFLDEINGHPIYIQPYADILSYIDSDQYEKEYCSNTNKDKEIVRKIDLDWDGYINLNWEADLYVLYGKSFYLCLKQYLNDNNIDDLRIDNIGYVNKKPVLVDYAGFNS